MNTRNVVALALTAVLAGVVSGCAPAPEKKTSSAATSGFLPCMVSDAGGFHDKSFNQLGFEGLETAADNLGVRYMTVESATETDFVPNLTSLIDQGCKLIVTVGYLLEEATKELAAHNPGVNFTIIDSALESTNIKPILFNTAQAAFLAGYAAASYSQTGVVGTYGGVQIPTVTIFMDGFAQGVEYYNKQKGTSVVTLGWNVATQTGSFTGGFEANQTAKTTAQGLIDQNVDVILPVGGPIFLSTIEAIKDSRRSIAMIGVDADLVETNAANAGLFLTSIIKRMSVAVSDVIQEAAAGQFSHTPYVGTLENDGVGLAPFHEFENKVAPTLPGELSAITTGIVDGSIVVSSPSAPQ